VGAVCLLAATGLRAQQDPGGGADDPPPLDLSGDEYESVAAAEQDGELERPWRRWFEQVTLSGYGAFSYLQTDSGGRQPGGDLIVNQASLFLDADLDDDVGLRFELWLDRFGDTNSDVDIAEAYAEIRGIADLGEDGWLTLRAGRVDIPFGEHYRYWDSPDNPLISFPVILPYRPDEGVMLFGEYRGVGFKAAFQEGRFGRQTGNFAKSATLRVSGEPLRDLYVSGSVFWNGKTDRTALCFTGNTLSPVGSGTVPSTLGASPSAEISAAAAEADLRWSFGEGGHLHLTVGHARVYDDVDAFDRDFTWFVVEPSYPVLPGLRLTARYSEAGTYSSTEGYRFENKPFGNGSASYGYDARRVSRLGVGVAWAARQHVIVKTEVGFDRYEAIDASPLGNDTRAFVGAELVLSF
jgi:hypothetical protein